MTDLCSSLGALWFAAILNRLKPMIFGAIQIIFAIMQFQIVQRLHLLKENPKKKIKK